MRRPQIEAKSIENKRRPPGRHTTRQWQLATGKQPAHSSRPSLARTVCGARGGLGPTLWAHHQHRRRTHSVDSTVESPLCGVLIHTHTKSSCNWAVAGCKLQAATCSLHFATCRPCSLPARCQFISLVGLRRRLYGEDDVLQNGRWPHGPVDWHRGMAEGWERSRPRAMIF